MTRSQFILSAALLVVSGTLAFTMSFRWQDRESLENQETKQKAKSSEYSQVSATTERRPKNVDSYRAYERTGIDRTHYDVSVARDEDRADAQIVAEKSREKLEKLTLHYDLTPLQRREIFPIIAGFHPNFREGMLVNGQSVPHTSYRADLSSSAYAFEDKIQPLLDTIQQEQLQLDVESKGKYRNEVTEQLLKDLERGIESGEMIPASELNEGLNFEGLPKN